MQNDLDKVSTVSAGISGLITLVLMILKFLGIVEWDWLWIFSPIWVPLCIAIITLFG